MVIEYRIKRFDLIKSYFYNLRHSRKTQLVVFGIATLIILTSMYRSYMNQGDLSLYDLIVALLSGLGLILAIPALCFLTAKTQKRTLSIDQEGIKTRIGSKEGKILWKAVGSVASTEDLVLITGKNANTFTIPSSAFFNKEMRKKFIDLASRYHENSKSACTSMR